MKCKWWMVIQDRDKSTPFVVRRDSCLPYSLIPGTNTYSEFPDGFLDSFDTKEEAEAYLKGYVAGAKGDKGGLLAISKSD